MEILTRDQILHADDRKVEEVEVPEWGGPVLVKELGGRERDLLEASIVTGPKQRDTVDIRAKVAVLSVVDHEGKQIFKWPNDVAELTQKSAQALDRIFPVAQRLSGLSNVEVEEIAKNSVAGPGEDSPSA